VSEYIGNSGDRQVLKEIILSLHRGEDLAEVKARFRELIGRVSALQIAQLEQELIDEGLPAEEVKELCDVHLSLFREALQDESGVELMPGHPVHTFKYENFAVGELLKLLAEAIAQLPKEDALERARAFAAQLAAINKIYLRKENILFPFLEKHGITGPASVMWAIHDEIRAQLKALRRSLQEGTAKRIKEVFELLARDIEQMFDKEEKVLYPTALKVLSDAEWLAIRDQSDEIGYCLIRPGDQWQPDIAAPGEAPQPKFLGEQPGYQMELDTGALTREQINLLLTNLPVDVTFVDEQDTVRYFSQVKQGRIFTRSKAIIGRKVQNCHPPNSVHVVNHLLEQFRSGDRDMAEFWIQMGARFVYIRYFALRDAEGKYRGTLEVSQDIAPLRALEGERRILDEMA